ncbi:MAG: dTMP kinase [Clostridium sp.]|nr:dTMP kinase [Clostridium sp.]MCM1444519.1 dTMP kinase [Candidatus Amulumruptor caecigallinarius]
MKGKLVLIEGTDCSGKETQSKLIVENITKLGYKSKYFSFPAYDTPTGKIIAGPLQGKPSYCKGYFEEGSPNVDPYVSSLYYAADRLYNIKKIESLLNNGYIVILDRYLYSNMAFQGAKIKDITKRKEMYNWIEKLEIDFLKLLVPDIKIFLHVETDIVCKLLNEREEEKDQNEMNTEFLRSAENAYLELCDIYDFIKIECVDNNDMRSIDSINGEIMDKINKILTLK